MKLTNFNLCATNIRELIQQTGHAHGSYKTPCVHHQFCDDTQRVSGKHANNNNNNNNNINDKSNKGPRQQTTNHSLMTFRYLLIFTFAFSGIPQQLRYLHPHPDLQVD